MTGQIAVTCRWYCKDKRRDPDNIGSAVKYILDGLVSAKIIPNDGWRQIGRIVHEYEQSKDDGVIVTLEQITTTEKTEETQK
jgi:Holliday junction resolvase RusA-like endonuclease